MALALGATFASVTVALADEPGAPAAATRRADDAKARVERGDYLGAAALFREAHGLAPRRLYLCNVGVAFYKAKDFPRASLYLERCLSDSDELPADFVSLARAALEGVRGELQRGPYMQLRLITRQAKVTATIDGFDSADVVELPTTLWVVRGQRQILARASGYRDGTFVAEPAPEAEVTTVTIALAPVDPAPARPPPVDGPRDAPRRASRIPAVVVTTGTVALAGGSLASYLYARTKAADAGRDDSLPGYEADVASARRWQRVSWISGGVAAAGAAASLYLWVRATKGRRLAVVPQPGGALASVGLSF